MPEIKTIQKNMKFSQEIVEELEVLCGDQRRSAQNMVEVLIHEAYVKLLEDQAQKQAGQGS